MPGSVVTRWARVLYRDDGEPESLTTTQRYMHLSPAAEDAAISLLDGGWPHLPGDILRHGRRDAGKNRWARKDEGPGIVEVSLWIPGPSIGEEYGT